MACPVRAGSEVILSRSFELILILLGSGCPALMANVGDLGAYGAPALSLSGAGVTGGCGAFNTYYNPAAIVGEVGPQASIRLDYSLVFLQPQLRPLGQLVLQNTYTGSTQVVDEPDVRIPQILGQAVGLALHLWPQFAELTLGLSSYLPLNHLAALDTGSTLQPDLFLYRSRTQQSQFEFALAQKAGPLAWGVGMRLGFSLTANAGVVLNTRPDQASLMRVASRLEPQLAPYFGALWQVGALEEDSGVTPLEIGLVGRLPLSNQSTFRLSSTSQILGELGSLPLDLLAQSTLLYEPYAVELGASIHWSARTRTILQGDYQLWRLFRAPTLLVKNSDDASTLMISPSPNLHYAYRNTFTPRVAQEIDLVSSLILRLSLAYKPGIIDGLNVGSGNPMDLDQLILGTGLGWSGERLWGRSLHWQLDLGFTYRRLLPASVNKSPGNEASNPLDQKVGAPGYGASGQIWGVLLGGSLAL